MTLPYRAYSIRKINDNLAALSICRFPKIFINCRFPFLLECATMPLTNKTR